MPRDYQRKRTKYILPKAVYHQALWIIRDYQRMKDRTESVQEKAVLIRAVGLISMQEPKKDSYTGACANCGKPIWQYARYCPNCGWRQPDFRPDW